MALLSQTLREQLSRYMGRLCSDASLGERLILKSGQLTTAGGAAAEAVTITGLTTSDYAVATIADNGTNGVTLLQTDVTADTLTLTFSADPGADCKVNYVIFRAN